MKYLLTIVGLIFSCLLFSQEVIPDIKEKSALEIHNREVVISKNEKTGLIEQIDFNAKQGDGLAIFKNIEFENGTIEFDVKGKDVLQQSFVGVAFHIQNDSTFNAVYFRPFNFMKSERTSHSVQYISHPKFTWQKLRTEFPEKFEKTVTPVPNPDEFFHAKVEVNWPVVKVFVENSDKPSIEVKMLSTFKKGKIGFWVGNGSDGTFKNLVVKSANQ
jgi:hypothetical protein